MTTLNIFFQIIIIFYLFGDSLSLAQFGFGSSTVTPLSFISREEIKRLISNNLNHEIFSQIPTTYVDSSIFFIIGNNQIKSVAYSNPIISTDVNIGSYELYHVSSYYLYLPKLMTGQQSVLFAFCTNSYYLSLYEYIGNNLNNKKLIRYEEFKIIQTKNECSGSSFIGKNDFNQKLYISNAY
jgi:hypothetical protein